MTNEQPPVALRQSWPIDGGEVEFIIRTAKPLPPGAYGLMPDVIDAASAMAELLNSARIDLQAKKGET